MTRCLRAELLLPVTIVAAAIMLGFSEFMTTFDFTSGGEPQVASLAADRHSYALLILAAFAVAGMVYAITTGLRPAAIATAIFGLAALLLFLVLDLPDAGRAGPLGDDPVIYFADARADPQTGFWMEAVGSVVLGLASVAFATLRSDQLRAPLELFRGKRQAAVAAVEAPSSSDRAAARERLAKARETAPFDAEAARPKTPSSKRTLPRLRRREKNKSR